MEIIKLPPKEIIVPGEFDIADETALRIYFNIAVRGYSEAIPPVVVTNENLFPETREEYLNYIRNEVRTHKKSGEGLMEIRGGSLIDPDAYLERCEKKAEQFEKCIARSPFYLLDGNHRSVALSLAGKAIHAYELKTQDDLKQLKEISCRNEIPEFPHKEYRSLKRLVYSFESWLRHKLEELHMDRPLNVQEKVDFLVRNDDLPDYMRVHYCRLKRRER
ncbi:hypothetical protein HYW75_01955 [Candidatus Pacearchaeota archaeon]|nr:hypothetical protein [Candidatus Pacearchaeota archaeon]